MEQESTHCLYRNKYHFNIISAPPALLIKLFDFIYIEILYRHYSAPHESQKVDINPLMSSIHSILNSWIRSYGIVQISFILRS